MYDTLMQMGRWFGYRPGYPDFCRLYTSSELVDWYRHITLASEELRQEFDHMAAVGGTPEDYGLRVRRHPNGLLITAVNKMPTGTRMQVSYAGSITETVVFDSDARIIEQNFRAFDVFFEQLGTPSNSNHGHIWTDVPGAEIVQLMSSVRTHPNSFKAQSNLMMKYIQAQLGKNELTRWTVALLSRSDASAFVTIAHRQVGLIERKRVEGANGKCSIQRLVSPRDEAIDLDKSEYESALLRTQDHWAENRGKYRRKEPPDLPSGAWIRHIRPPERGLLLVYPLETLGCDPAPLMGFAVSFPSSETAVAVEYVVNNVYWEQEFGAQ
jgi:Z1 domain